jgi:hypothetical protein
VIKAIAGVSTLVILWYMLPHMPEWQGFTSGIAFLIMWTTWRAERPQLTRRMAVFIVVFVTVAPVILPFIFIDVTLGVHFGLRCRECSHPKEKHSFPDGCSDHRVQLNGVKVACTCGKWYRRKPKKAPVPIELGLTGEALPLR